MPLPVTRLRRWFAAIAILMVVIVAGMYFYARWRVSRAVHEIPAKIGLDIQQTAEGFSISKSDHGRTEFTVSASKAVQFKESGRADLHKVKIVVYGKDSSRFDQIAGDDFEFDPKSGDVTARGRVLIDLEANPGGAKSADQAPPSQSGKPIHLESDGLVFNKNTGNASASGKVTFETPQAKGSAVGVDYVARTGTMTLRSAVEVAVNRKQPFQLRAAHGVITKGPAQIVLDTVTLNRENERLESERATFFLRNDNTVERILAEGNVQAEVHGPSDTHARSDQAELFLTGTRNELTTAILSGHVHLETHGAEPGESDAGKATLYFAANQVLKKVHAEDGVRLFQNRENKSATAGAGLLTNAQQVEMTAPVMDFLVKNGNLLESAVTSGPPKIVIMQPSTRQKTIITAAKFTATFTGKNRLSVLHGEPDARIVGSAPGQPDRVSASPTLDAVFQPEGGISTITQAGGVTYVSATQKAWAQRGTYRASDQMLMLNGAPRVTDGGMTTTAETISFNRATGDALAEGNVKSTYSDLKAQPDGAMLASSDPIHVVSARMAAHRSPAIAVYTGNARLWQNSNVVEAPTIEFDRDRRSLVAQASGNQPVKTILVQVDAQTGKATPVTITATHLTYTDEQRTALFEGGVTAKGSAEGSFATMTSRQMTVYMVARGAAQNGSASPATSSAPSVGTSPAKAYSVSAGSSVSSIGGAQVEKIIAEDGVVLTEPMRRATGDRLVYTAGDDKFVLTGKSPSIFDAERGKITGDSLTFYRHFDRVLVEGKKTAPAITRTQVAR
ncbi:MAG: LPS export ABC transporter periplasmic protein LptC [Terriglobales bacterium]